eukprot:m.68442 g.68442  ORF g.68442 m.68442 type:complete len:291 (-) comp8245_c0_seq6:1229-2101(-)
MFDARLRSQGDLIFRTSSSDVATDESAIGIGDTSNGSFSDEDEDFDDNQQIRPKLHRMPSEILCKILPFLLRTANSVRDIARVGMTCRRLYFFVFHGDDYLWKECAHILFPLVQSLSSQWRSWRILCLTCPRPFFHGVYVSKIVYYRRGEKSLDDYYKAFHTVEYYRYIRFFRDGQVGVVLTSHEPQRVLKSLTKAKIGDIDGLIGEFKVRDNTVVLVSRRLQEQVDDAHNSNTRRRRCGGQQRQQQQDVYIYLLQKLCLRRQSICGANVCIVFQNHQVPIRMLVVHVCG